jgi:hypothetical protein
MVQAVETAYSQSTKSLELRARMSSSRLWQQQGKTAEARQRLAEIYRWFSDGFDTKDLSIRGEDVAGVIGALRLDSQAHPLASWRFLWLPFHEQRVMKASGRFFSYKNTLRPN